YVVLDNVNVTTTTSNVIYGVAQRTHISFNDSNVTSSSQVFSLQGTNKWSGEQAAVYDLSFTDSSVQGSYIAYIAPYANSATAASRTATVTLGGENTFKYTDTKDGVPFYGFPYYTGTASSTRVALIDPANGYVQASEGYLPIVTLPTEAVGGVYTVSTNVEKAIKIEWDADGDGIVEKTEYVVSGATPAHEDGEKAPDTVNQIRYEFAGWLKNGAGDPITNLSAETVTEDVLYKAFFNSVAITKTYNITFDPNNGESVKVVATPEGVTPVYGTDPEKTSADKIYTFVGWSPDGGTTLYTADTLPTAQAEATYTAIYTSELIPWAYTASSSAVSYFVTLADAVAAHDADSGDGTIRMLRDYTNSSSVAVTKDTTIDLNGFTLTDSSGNNVFSLSGATPAVLTITSTGSNGKIVKSGARNIVAFGTSTGSVYPENAVGVTLENLTIDASGATAGQVNAAYLANVTYKLVNCEVNTAKPFFSFQSNAKWTSDMSAYWNFVFEDTQITSGDGIVYALTSATGTATPAESCHVSVKLGGSNTFKYKSYAAQYGFRYTPNGGSLTSLIVPANGYVSGTDGSAPIVTLPTGMEGGYYTIETISGIPVYWDTNNDGTYDDITGVNGTNPVHADGSKPFEAETKTQYTFIGWYDGETLYAPGDPIPVPTEAAYYTAKFTASVATGATAFYMDAAGVVTPLEGDVQALLATYGGAAKTFTLLDDYTLSADLNLYGVPVLDLGGYTLDGNYAINVTQDAEIKNGTVNVTGASAISATGGNLMLTDLTVHAQQIAVDLQAFGSINKLTNVSLYAGESLGSGYPALKVGAATAKTTVAGCFLVTGSADSPLIDAAASVEINSFEAYISDVYYADMDNYTWYYEAADGLVYALQWVVARGTETVPGTSFAGYHHVFASKPTAKIGSKYFGTLYEAVNAVVKTGGTVTLLHDTNVAEEIEAGAGTAVQYYYVDSAKGAVTIDLNGFTVYGSSTCRTFTLSGANPVTFMNGKLDLSNQGNTAGNYGVLLGAGGSTLRMINVDMVAQIRAIYLATGDVNKLVEIIGGSYTMTNTSAENGLVTFSINRTNPRASGNTLRISENAKFTRNAQYAIYMTELDTCEITSAEFHVAANGKAISEEDVTVYVNESQMTKTEEPASGTYIYKALEEQYVVENNGTKYFTLTDALAAAKSGDQLKVLRDFSEKLTNAVIPSTISISMNGHKVTFEAGSVVNGVTFPENRVIDTALNLKKVSLTIKDPLQMNLKFASSDLTVTAGDLVMNSITASGSYTAYSFIVEKTDFTKYYDVWATNGSAYGIPEKISVKRYADAAQSGSNQSLKDLTASLMNYGMNSSGYNSSEKYTGIDAYDKAVASEILSASADGFALTYVGEMTDVTVAYKDVYGMGVKPYMDGTTFNLASPANVLGQIVITDGSGTTETDTLMSALKASGSKYAAIYGYYAAQYFGN
ncbi:MAG: InlB B-repeat-containing protein, partial [Oscillospiraceae bacterium]|nr:InlB B-repeat-containing protein [Oscillospiraceae bacterium]